MTPYPFTLHDLRAMVKALLTTSRYTPAEIKGTVYDEIYEWIEHRRLDVDEIRRDRIADREGVE